MSDFFGKIKFGAEKVAFEAEKMTRLSKAKGDLEKIKSMIQGQYMKLGQLYFSQRNTSGVTGLAFDELCQAILDLENQIEAKNKEVAQIDAEEYETQAAVPAAPQPPAAAVSADVPPPPAAPAPAAKFCSNCGKVQAERAKFCPDCGTPV